MAGIGIGICTPMARLAASSDPIVALGAAAYWRADQGVSDTSAAVDSWTDRVAGYELTQTGTARPTLSTDGSSQKYLAFDGSDDHLFNGSISALSGQLDGDAGFHWFARLKIYTASGMGGLFAVGTGSKSWNSTNIHVRGNTPGTGRQRALVYDSGGSLVRDRDSLDGISNATMGTQEGRVRGPSDDDILWRLDGVDDSAGADVWSGGTMPTGLDTFSIGNLRGGLNPGGYHLHMDLYAIAIFAGPISDADSAATRAELASVAS